MTLSLHRTVLHMREEETIVQGKSWFPSGPSPASIDLRNIFGRQRKSGQGRAPQGSGKDRETPVHMHVEATTESFSED
jgi:hypothetical protein